MEETFLITGNQHEVQRSLLTNLLNLGNNIICTREADDDNSDYLDREHEKLSVYEYQRRSPFSSRGIFLDLQNKKRTVDHIIICRGTVISDETIQNLSSRDIESRIDDEVKGFVFFLKESISYSEKHRGASINIVLHTDGPAVPGLMDGLVSGAVESFSNSLFAYYSQDELIIRGFTSRESDSNEYSAHIIQTIGDRKPSGRWYPLKGKGKLFSLGR